MPAIRYGAPLKLLVAVRGHPFDRTAFDALFQAMPGVFATMVDQPVNPDGMAPYDALVLYDMPGLDFDADPRPGLVDPGAAVRRGIEALAGQGKGIVALHHAIAGWPAWPGYAAPDVVPLLRARYRFEADGFHSAGAAMDGRMFDNSGWRRSPGTDLIGWTRRAGNSPLVYLQPGGGASAYGDPVYRRLVENAVRWVASPEARLG